MPRLKCQVGIVYRDTAYVAGKMYDVATVAEAETLLKLWRQVGPERQDCFSLVSEAQAESEAGTAEDSKTPPAGEDVSD